jgi:hypothetical protein
MWDSDWTVKTAPAPIPFGCICAYTWSVLESRQVRNSPVASCPADHTEIDKAAAAASG